MLQATALPMYRVGAPAQSLVSSGMEVWLVVLKKKKKNTSFGQAVVLQVVSDVLHKGLTCHHLG